MQNKATHCPPDLSTRPLDLTVEKTTVLTPEVIFQAWTKGFGDWFAEPGTVLMSGEQNTPFFFEVHHQGNRHPHYGRFLRVESNKLVEITWLTRGTKGVETVVTIEIEPAENGTKVKLRHAGFPDEESRDAHKGAWPMVLDQMENKLKDKK